MKKIFKGIGIIFIVFIILGTIGNMMPNDKTTGSLSTTEKQQPYEITELVGNKDGYIFQVTGLLKNNTNKDKSYVQVLIPVFDADGNKLGDALANTNNLAAGQTWKFEASYFGDIEDVSSFSNDQIQVDGF